MTKLTGDFPLGFQQLPGWLGKGHPFQQFSAFMVTSFLFSLHSLEVSLLSLDISDIYIKDISYHLLLTHEIAHLGPPKRELPCFGRINVKLMRRATLDQR